MKRFLWLLGLGLFVFVLSLVARFPADVAYRALADQMGDRLSVSSIEGTVFAGKATVVVENDFSFDSVAWRWRPTAALSGRLEFGTRWAIPAGELGARVGLEIGGAPLVGSNDENWPVMKDGKAIGYITSAIHSPRLEKNIALAMVAIEHAEIGNEASVQMPGETRACHVAPKPFFDPGKTIAAKT